ncbi:hypothetical protein [Alkalicoccus halolimnae]|uniref:Uncharacterized protein n=1 Tax=Alkalicoccus halolimnae TaxID=1667239 RepID=A0A5C7F829_9BACI|nr:hypothetical protein [Alkalicoccus halolimnae]TXF86213.1 hypothetical protein FTX54_06290 [Alkalicoccus halolimnae]
MSNEMGQAIVDGVLQGYKDYLQERREKRNSMHISSAYAWTKGNHIDHNVVESSKNQEVKFAKARAGYSWGYLQFGHEQTSSMFIIKNGKYFDEKNFTKSKDIRGRSSEEKKESYIKRLANINDSVDFPEQVDITKQGDSFEVVSFMDPEMLQEIEEPSYKELLDKFNRFYVVTYEIDAEHVISQVRLMMPNPNDGVAYEVDDLTHLIGTSTVRFETQDFDTVKEEAKERDAMLDYGIMFNVGKTGEDENN